ncbi:AbiTii domain-containing protein [Pseudomonas frederiksbergensis]|uniref:AbiTii domain-containing protein n=1 Tax=Pseudomonas frederiksbergensis TaxID=104087 RepID=UPI002DBD29F6|nr:hypothetical protein [Pseudomonas frederiksbergensis]WRV66609.1 hypothetical protein VQ575_17165 [Pseudomonas frederiksbergensis]
MSDKNTRISEARSLAASLLDDLENSSSAVDRILMKAKRLARLMRDADAQLWLDYETKGYPKDFSFKTIGSCEKYAISSGRYNLAAGNYYTQSLSEYEAIVEGARVSLSSFSPAAVGAVKDFVEKNATEVLLNSQLKIHRTYKDNYSTSKATFISFMAGLHNYATDMYLALELGDAAQDIFETARNEIDSFVRAHCPKAAEKIVAINERIADGSTESRTAALTSCRRLLMTVADSLFPATDVDWIDQKGKARKVGEEQYKNRILAYMSDRVGSGSNEAILSSELEFLAARLDAIYEKTCKGVHVDVTTQEARLAVIHTYLFIGEIALLPRDSIK